MFGAFLLMFEGGGGPSKPMRDARAIPVDYQKGAQRSAHGLIINRDLTPNFC